MANYKDDNDFKSPVIEKRGFVITKAIFIECFVDSIISGKYAHIDPLRTF